MVPIQLPAGKAPAGDTRVQFHADQVRLLVAHETQLAIYDTSKMDRNRQVWFGRLLTSSFVRDKPLVPLLFINFFLAVGSSRCPDSTDLIRSIFLQQSISLCFIL